MKKYISQSETIEIKKSMLDSLLLITLVVGLPALIAVIINSRETGSFPYFSLAGLIVLLVIAIFRKKVPFLLKAWIMITFGYLIGTRGLLNEGLLSDGLFYYIFISILSSMLIDIRSGVITMIVTLLTTSLITYAISRNWLIYKLDIVSYFYSPSAWIAFLMTIALFTSVAVFIYGRLEKYLVQYISELTQKTDTLNKSNIRLEKEIEERQTAEKQLNQSENRFRNVFNSIGDGIVLLRQDHSIVDINDGFLEMTGLSCETLLHKNFKMLFSDPDKLFSPVNPEHGFPAIFNKNENLLITSKNKISVPVEVTLLPFQYDPDITHIALIKDIKEKKENETKIMNAIINSEEEERLRIAQDLHDGVGPYLSAASIYINSMEVDKKDTKSKRIKNELSELMNLSISTIREISGNLGSQMLRSLGLKAALASFIKKIRLQSQVIFELSIPEQYPFLENVEVTLYRILVELINNSLKYGSPKKIIIELVDAPSSVSLNYYEDGCGFNMQDALITQKGMGLYNIHSRINAMGGSIDYYSRPGKGVTVRLSLSRSTACKQD
jgi:PAS domain S-box-containing protein